MPYENNNSNGSYLTDEDRDWIKARTGKVTGLWGKETRNGKMFYQAKISVSQIQDAVKTTEVMMGKNGARVKPEEAQIVIKMWHNQDKFNDRSPDMSLSFQPPAPRREEPTATEQPPSSTAPDVDDIPF